MVSPSGVAALSGTGGSSAATAVQASRPDERPEPRMGIRLLNSFCTITSQPKADNIIWALLRWLAQRAGASKTICLRSRRRPHTAGAWAVGLEASRLGGSRRWGHALDSGSPITQQLRAVADCPWNQLRFETLLAVAEAFRGYLAQLRWPEGFRRPQCGQGKGWPALDASVPECVASGWRAAVTAVALSSLQVGAASAPPRDGASDPSPTENECSGYSAWEILGQREPGCTSSWALAVSVQMSLEQALQPSHALTKVGDILLKCMLTANKPAPYRHRQPAQSHACADDRNNHGPTVHHVDPMSCPVGRP